MAVYSDKQTAVQPKSPETAHEHELRIKQELRAAGATHLGLSKFALRHLPNIIHPSEHIKGIVYGRYGNGASYFKLNEGSLVATDRRVIFVDYKPGYSNIEELTYDVISGIKHTTSGFFAGITLFTRIGTYELHYVNTTCAAKFMEYIEKRRVESEEIVTSRTTDAPEVIQKELPTAVTSQSNAIDAQTHDFLRSHDTAVLSTISRNGDVHGAAVHYFNGADGNLFILTKSGSGKAHDIFAHRQVALTAFDVSAMQTVQLNGIAEIVDGRQLKDWIWRTATAQRQYGDITHRPPVVYLRDGSFIAIRITPEYCRFSDYKVQE